MAGSNHDTDGLAVEFLGTQTGDHANAKDDWIKLITVDTRSVMTDIFIFVNQCGNQQHTLSCETVR